MSLYRVLPLEERFSLSKLFSKNGETSSILSSFEVKSLTVDTENNTWLFCLLLEENTWKKTRKDLSLQEIEALLARLGVDLQARYPLLQKVSWQIPTDLELALSSDRETANGKTLRRSNHQEPEILMGRSIRVEPRPISSITGAEKDFSVVLGQVMEISWRESQNGGVIGSFILADKDDAISVKIFPDAEIFPSLKEALKEGIYVKIRGRVREDRFDSEPQMIANDINLEQPFIRPCDSQLKRAELHLHTKMSQMDSVLEVESAFERASLWGYSAIAITDHGVVQAFPKAYDLGKKYGIKVIYGLEGYLVEDGKEKERPYHVIILARNRKGLRNLYEIVTKSHLEHFYRTPRIPRSLLSEKREGLLIGSACEAGELFSALLSGRDEKALWDIASFYDYLEIQPLDNNAFLIGSGAVTKREDLAALNKEILQISLRLGKPCVMTCDVHYLDPEDEMYRTLLLSGKGMAEGEKATPLFLRTTNELMDEASSYLGEENAFLVVVENPRKIADSIEELIPVPEGSYFPSLDGADASLRTMAYEKAYKRYGNPLPAIVRDRLEKELSAIIGNGFSSLYIIAIKMVEKSLKDGYLVGSRGSVGSSLVATMTGITEVNPLAPHYVCPHCRHSEFILDGSVSSGFDLPPKECPNCGNRMERDGQDIPFETFMGFTGEKVPDIDLNFSGEEQGEMFRFANQLLGDTNVFRAGTIGTIARKTAFGFVKHFAEEKGIVYKKAQEIRLAKGIEGVKRTTGQHPGGVMVIPKGMDVLDFTPLQYPADDRNSGAVTTHFDYESISGHLVKVDILGHDDPTVLKMLHKLTGVDPLGIPMDDPGTLRLLSGENPQDAIGIPEFNTRFVRGMLGETKPKSFADLVRISGLSHGTDVWATNAKDLIKEGKATLSQVIATREDIFLYLMKQGMDSAQAFSISEKVRKGKSLSPDDIKAMEDAGVPQWYTDSCRKISYLFPKAHAVAYVTTAFRIGYFKAHYPLAFYAAYFSFHGSSLTTELIRMGKDKWKEYIQRVLDSPNPKAKELDEASALEVATEMYDRGFAFGQPDISISQAKNYVIEGNRLIPPFTAIPGIGSQAAASIVQARNEGPFISVEDFRERTRLGKKVTGVLREEGVLAGLPETCQLNLF